VRLDPADIEAIATRVAELTAGQRAEPAVRYLDAARLARMLGVEPGWVYANASRLGAIRLGGPKGRLRFDVQHATRALAAPPAGAPAGRPVDRRSCGRARRRSRPAARLDLLPYES
jgi:hypothetical protein